MAAATERTQEQLNTLSDAVTALVRETGGATETSTTVWVMDDSESAN